MSPLTLFTFGVVCAMLAPSLIPAQDVTFAASEALRCRLAEARVKQGWSNVNYTYYSSFTDADLPAKLTALDGSKPLIKPTVIPLSAAPIREVVTSVRVHRPLLLFQDPRPNGPYASTISIADVSVQNLPSPATNHVGLSLGSVTLENRAISQPLSTFQYVDLRGVQFLSSPRDGSGSSLIKPPKGK